MGLLSRAGSEGRGSGGSGPLLLTSRTMSKDKERGKCVAGI